MCTGVMCYFERCGGLPFPDIFFFYFAGLFDKFASFVSLWQQQERMLVSCHLCVARVYNMHVWMCVCTYLDVLASVAFLGYYFCYYDWIGVSRGGGKAGRAGSSGAWTTEGLSRVQKPLLRFSVYNVISLGICSRLSPFFVQMFVCVGSRRWQRKRK